MVLQSCAFLRNNESAIQIYTHGTMTLMDDIVCENNTGLNGGFLRSLMDCSDRKDKCQVHW